MPNSKVTLPEYNEISPMTPNWGQLLVHVISHEEMSRDTYLVVLDTLARAFEHEHGRNLFSTYHALTQEDVLRYCISRV